jgi:hypothetical protein
MAARSDHATPVGPGADRGVVTEEAAVAAPDGAADEPAGTRLDPTLPTGVVVRGPTQRLRRVRP